MKRNNTKGDLLKGDKKPPVNNVKKEKKITSNIKDISDKDVNISKDIGIGFHESDGIINDEDPKMISEFPTSVMDVTKTENKLDFAEVLDDRWSLFSKYFLKHDYINNLLINKNFGKLSILHLISLLETEQQETELKLNNLKEVK